MAAAKSTRGIPLTPSESNSLERRSRRELPETSVGRSLQAKRAQLLETARRYGVYDLTLFGSVARGQDDPESDVDLVASIPATIGLVTLAQLERELSEILARPVDLVPADGLRPQVQDAVIREGIPL